MFDFKRRNEEIIDLKLSKKRTFVSKIEEEE